MAQKDSDMDVNAVTFYMNPNIVYLPVNISENLPNLIKYNAAHCKIKELFNENFRGLWDLEELELHHNEIEKIKYDTFQRLYKLQRLQLSEFKGRLD
jgi:Leucine-rich repeat (LRR) protein